MHKSVLILAATAALVVIKPSVSSATPIASSTLNAAASTAPSVEKIEYGWPYGGGYPYRYWDRGWSYGRGWPYGGGYYGYYRPYGYYGYRRYPHYW